MILFIIVQQTHVHCDVPQNYELLAHQIGLDMVLNVMHLLYIYMLQQQNQLLL
jgi:hypothetical protein